MLKIILQGAMSFSFKAFDSVSYVSYSWFPFISGFKKICSLAFYFQSKTELLKLIS